MAIRDNELIERAISEKAMCALSNRTTSGVRRPTSMWFDNVYRVRRAEFTCANDQVLSVDRIPLLILCRRYCSHARRMHSKHELTRDTRSDRSTDPYLGTILFYVNAAHALEDRTLTDDIFCGRDPAFDKPSRQTRI